MNGKKPRRLRIRWWTTHVLALLAGSAVCATFSSFLTAFPEYNGRLANTLLLPSGREWSLGGNGGNINASPSSSILESHINPALEEHLSQIRTRALIPSYTQDGVSPKHSKCKWDETKITNTRCDVHVLFRRLVAREPFSYAHFNDGEILAMMRTDGTTGRGLQKLSSELQGAMSDAFHAEKPGLVFGLPDAREWKDASQYANEQLGNSIVERTLATVFINQNYQDSRFILLEYIKRNPDRKVHMVVSEKADMKLFESKTGIHPSTVLKVPANDGFPTGYYDNINSTSTHEPGDLVILCAGSLGRMLAVQWFLQRPQTTYLELGSFFDLDLFGRSFGANYYSQKSGWFVQKDVVMKLINKAATDRFMREESEIYQPDTTTTGRRLVTIPKILVQSYTDVAMVPPKVYENVRTYAPEWDHLIFDDGNATAFLDKHFDSGVAARFRNLTEGSHKADLFRYAFLYVHGGVWLDMDVELRAPLKDALERENTIYTAKSGVFDDIFQAVLAVPPKVPFMKRLVEEIVESDLNGRGLPFTVWFKKALLRSTGQARLQVGKVMESKKSDERVTDFYLFRETCSRSTTAKCPVLDKYGLCCWVMDGSKVIFKARYHDYPFK